MSNHSNNSSIKRDKGINSDESTTFSIHIAPEFMDSDDIMNLMGHRSSHNQGKMEKSDLTEKLLDKVCLISFHFIFEHLK